MPAYIDGTCFLLRMHVANTGPATLNVNGLGPKVLKKFVTGLPTDLAPGELGVDQKVLACYDSAGATALHVMSLGGGAGAGTTLLVQEIDGSPSGTFGTLKFSNGSVTNNGDGTATIVTGGTGGGDASTNTSTSVDGEVALFSGAGGKTLKRATGSGLGILTAGVLGAVDPSPCNAPTFVRDVTAAGALTCVQANFTDLAGSATDAQIPALNTLSTTLALNQCVQTDGAGLLSTSGSVCGAGGGAVDVQGTPTGGQTVEWVDANTLQGVATTGTGSVVKATNPTMTLANATGLPFATGLTGTASDAQIPHLNTLSTGLSLSQCVQTDASGLLSSTGSACGTGGGVTDGNKGDLTVSGAGATWTINANTITYAKLQDITAASRVLGRGSAAGAGDPQELTLGTTLAMSGTVLDVGTTVARLDTANAWADGVKQTFNPNATTAGLNVGAQAGDPSTPVNGDLWYDSTANELTARINGANVALGAGGAGVTDGNKGDIRVEGGGTSWLLNPDVVSLGALSNMAASTLMGRLTAGTGDPEHLTPAQAKTVLALSNVDNTSDASKNVAAVELTNKKITARVLTHADTTPVTVNTDLYETVVISELSQNTTFSIPTGTAQRPDQFLAIDLFTTTARTLTFTTGTNGYCAHYDIPLPTQSVAGKRVRYGFVWNSVASCWGFDATTSTGTVGTIHLPVGSVTLPDINPATIDGSGAHLRLLFDATTAQCATWGPFRMNSDYRGSPVFKWQYSMTSSTTGGVSINVALLVNAPGSGQNVYALPYDTPNNCDDAAVPTPLGSIREISCPLVTTANLAAGRFAKIQLCRAVTDAVDTASGFMEGVTATLEYVR